MDKATNEFNNFTLVNEKYESILDIIGTQFKTTKEIREAKKTIFKYLTKSFSGLSYKRISDMFESVKKEYPERLYKNSTVDDIRLNLFYFASYIAEIGESYKDYGYSLLLAYFFWITRDI
jgi:hypothetical protein